MTLQEWRNHEEYAICMKKILSYKPGFEFTIDYTKIPEKKHWFLKNVMMDAINKGYIESIAIGLDIKGSFTDETFRKLGNTEVPW